VQEESSPNFADRFLRAMARAGLKPARIAEMTGISKGYLSELKSGKKAGPSPEAGKKLAEVLGVSPEWLMMGSDSENAESSTSPKKSGLSETTRHAWEEPHRGRSAERMVPVVGWAHAGDAENYEELPKSWQNKVPTDCADPKAFGVSLEGYSMEPKFSDGDILIVQPSAEFHSGCYVVARFLNDGVIFRRLEIRGARIILVPLNPQYLASEHTAEEFSWIYPVWARITKLWKK